MSADNWTTCPKCTEIAATELERKKKEVKDSYGKVSEEDYVHALKETQQPLEYRESLREDYELGIDDKGMFYVSYSCSCDECDFAFEYRYKQKAYTSLKGVKR